MPYSWQPDDLPKPASLPEDWPHAVLHERVESALYALSAMFHSDLRIVGVAATDLHTLASSLGASIELQTVLALNQLRHLWDPDARYATYRFVRQSQQFPDVILKCDDPACRERIIMGIELKGWYVLAKESESTFRFKTTPAVCQPQDLLVVVPWALGDVVSGSPVLFEPWIVAARFAAEWRNWFWRNKMAGAIVDRGIRLSEVSVAYPDKAAPISDQPNSDSGSNFGRLARYEIMDDFTEKIAVEPLLGIPVGEWRRFLTRFKD